MMMQMGSPIARVELIDDESVEAFNKAEKRKMPITPHLFMEFHGSETYMNEQINIVEEITKDHGAGEFNCATKTEERNALWG